MTDDSPAVFDDAVRRNVLESESVDEAGLVDALGVVQAVVGSFGNLSVDDVVYEWRTQHHKDPLVSSTPDAYYLDVREHVWDDILTRGDIDEEFRGPVRTVHAAQFESDRDETAPTGAMVLSRA